MEERDGFHSFCVTEVINETEDSRSFVLEIPTSLRETYSHAVGQFCAVRATINGVQEVRNYPISRSIDNGERFAITVNRFAEELMSSWLVDLVAPGSLIDVSRPFGLFELRGTDSSIIALADDSGQELVENLDISPEKGKFIDVLATERVHIQINHKSTSIAYKAGDTILETARRDMLYPPFLCRRGNCGTCKALVTSGTAEMRSNDYLTRIGIKDGWVLTCQATPTSREIFVNYDARRFLPGFRFLLRTVMSSPIRRNSRSQIGRARSHN